VVFFNYTTMQVSAKIVYYGPGLCGKTTNLQQIHSRTESGSRGEMVSLETEADRTLFFDLLPLEVGTIGGMRVRLQLYTVPGQVFYNTTRKLVLKGVDGIVFVADSQVPALDANVESMENLERNVSELGVSLDTTPMVLQFNKRDLRNIHTIETLNERLNRRNLEVFEGAALHGIGVFETLKAISRKTLAAVHRRITGSRGPAPNDESSSEPVSPLNAAQTVALVPTLAAPVSLEDTDPAIVAPAMSISEGAQGPKDLAVESDEPGDDELSEVTGGGDVEESIVREGEPISPEGRPLSIDADPDTSEVKIEFAASGAPDPSGSGELDTRERLELQDESQKRVVTKSPTDIERELEQLRTQALGAPASTQPARRVVSIQKRAELSVGREVLERARTLSLKVTLESESGDRLGDDQTIAIELPGLDSAGRARLALEIDLAAGETGEKPANNRG